MESKRETLHFFRLGVHKEGDEYYNLCPCGNQWFYKIERILPYINGKCPEFFIHDKTPTFNPHSQLIRTTITEYESLQIFHDSFPEYLI